MFKSIFLLSISIPLFAQPASHVLMGPTTPVKCSPKTGDVFFVNSGTTGLRQCTSVNTWSVVGSGGGNSGNVSGQAVLGTAPISANTCASTVSVAATGVLTTSSLVWTPNADISGLTGYGPAATDGLIVSAFPTSNFANFKVCNGTALAITPGAVTLNWAVVTAPTFLINVTAVLGTSAIAANTCASVVTVAATGVVSTDSIAWTPNVDISSVTGYGSASTDGLVIFPYPTTDNVNFKVCNVTGSSITPGAVTLNGRVSR